MTVTVVGILLSCLDLSGVQIFQGQSIEPIHILRQYFARKTSSLNLLEQQTNIRSVAGAMALTGVIIYRYSSFKFQKMKYYA